MFSLDPGSDADLFWDDDGTAYVIVAGNGLKNQFSLDIETGAIGPITELWNGTGRVCPEGPHMYKKDEYYHLMIAEGGTEQNHSETIARPRNRLGP
jgi:beta-xylosidase